MKFVGEGYVRNRNGSGMRVERPFLALGLVLCCRERLMSLEPRSHASVRKRPLSRKLITDECGIYCGDSPGL